MRNVISCFLALVWLHASVALVTTSTAGNEEDDDSQAAQVPSTRKRNPEAEASIEVDLCKNESETPEEYVQCLAKFVNEWVENGELSRPAGERIKLQAYQSHYMTVKSIVRGVNDVREDRRFAIIETVNECFEKLVEDFIRCAGEQLQTLVRRHTILRSEAIAVKQAVTRFHFHLDERPKKYLRS